MDETQERQLHDQSFMLWVLLAQTSDALRKARHIEYKRYGISTERRAILYAILNNGGKASPVEITHHLFRELHSVTGMLKRMESDGLVKRTKGSGRSKVEIAVTQKGLDIFNQSLHNDADTRIFSVLSDEEREFLQNCLLKLRRRALADLGVREWQLGYPSTCEIAEKNGDEER